jgi:hypothetical protein
LAVPSILLAIYAGLVVSALVLSSVSAHLHPAPEQVRRVTHAVERAAWVQLVSPARWGMAGACVLGIAASIVGAREGIPLLWTCLVPVLAALLSGASLFLATRMVHRGISSSVALDGRPPNLPHCAREFMAAVLLTGGTSVGLGWLIEILAASSLDAQKTRFLVLLGLLGAGSVCALCARAATSSAITSQGATESAPVDPHGGSLAMLVGSSFHFPLLVLSVWSLLAMLGHFAFLPPVTAVAADSSASTGASSLDRMLYSPLLQLLGLFAVAFGAWAARVSEGEALRFGWMRAGLVTWALLLIGCWSFSSQLPPAVAYSTPACMSGLLLLLPVFTRTPPLLTRPALGNAVGFLALLTVFVLCAPQLRFVQLSVADLGTILGAAAAAILPLAVVQLFATSVEATRRSIASLAFVQLPSPAIEQRGTQLLGVVPGLGLLLALVSLQTQLKLPAGGTALALGLSVASGAAVAAFGSSLLSSNCIGFQRRLSALINPHAGADDAALDLEAANKICQEAISSQVWLWALILVAPSSLLLLSRWVLDDSSWAAWGLALGSCVFGVGHAWSTHHTSNDVKKMTGMTSLSNCLLQFLLIFLMMSSF